MVMGLTVAYSFLSQLLCARCQALSNGAMIPAVEDFSQKQQAVDEPRSMAGRRLLQPQELRAQLEGLANKRYVDNQRHKHHHTYQHRG